MDVCILRQCDFYKSGVFLLAKDDANRRVFMIKLAGESRANRTLLPSVWAAAAVPASVLTGARKLKGSWILARLSGLIQIARRTRLDKGVFMRQPGTVNPPD
jgi:hypothetical protein